MAMNKEIFRRLVALPAEARAELAAINSELADETSPEIACAQVTEVRRRIAQVDAGEATLIPGNEVLARVRSLLAEDLPSS